MKYNNQTSKWLKLSTLTLAFQAPLAHAGCYTVEDEPSARYCRGVSADTIIHLRDHKIHSLRARLQVIPEEIKRVEAQLVPVRAEKDALTHRRGYLEGELQQMARITDLAQEALEGWKKVREEIGLLQALPENILPRVLAELRIYLKSNEDKLDALAAALDKQAVNATPKQKEALELTRMALQELKVFKKGRKKTKNGTKDPSFMRDVENSQISPFARVLLLSAEEAEAFQGRAMAILQLLERTASEQLDRIEMKLEEARAAEQARNGFLNEIITKLTACSERIASLEGSRAALAQEEVDSRNEIAGIPDRIRHLIWMQDVGCGQAHRRTVCPPPQREEPARTRDWKD
jgi:predicted nuclease with TOPRIM domain